MQSGIFILVVTISAAPAGESATAPIRTLGRVFTKLKGDQPVTIAYFGGSITAASGYRVQVTKWFREHFPKAEVHEVNAAIGGTGSDLGAFPLRRRRRGA